jgi:hypothetical protein
VKSFKITKYFQGGRSEYYAKMSVNSRMGHGNWTHQLEEWGEGTSGGHNYGYQIKVSRVKSIPRKTSSHRKLMFNKDYLRRS